MASAAYYVVRFLEPKQTGLGEFVLGFSTNVPPVDLKDVQKRHPDKFQKPGFYSLMVGTSNFLTVETPK